MREWAWWIVGPFCVVGLVIAIAYPSYRFKKECQARGGDVIRTYQGYECVEKMRRIEV